MSDDRLHRMTEAELLLEEISDRLLEDAPAHEVWPITAYSLAANARSHHHALLDGLDGRVPRASEIHARPIVETAILMHYLSELPEVRVWLWVADGISAQRKMLREWLESVELGHSDDASPTELREMIDAKTALLEAAEGAAKREADAHGVELDRVALPSTYEQAKRDPQLFGLYTKGFRHLSSSVHVAATLFTEDRYGEAMSLLDDSLDEERRVAVRALAAGVLAVVYADAARVLNLDDLVERTGAVHRTLAGHDE